jgi:PAS domain S-box-containing protein
MYAIRKAGVCCFVWLAVLAADAGVVSADPTVKGVLLLHQYGANRPFRAAFDAAFFEALRLGDSVPIDLYSETIEIEGVPGERSQRDLEYLRHKYVDRRIDVVITFGNAVLDFVRQNREMFGNPPVVAFASVGQIQGSNDDVTGLEVDPSYGSTLDLALTLLPGSRAVYVVDGERNNTGYREELFNRQFRERRRDISVSYLRDLPLSDLVSRLSAIPDRSIVLFLTQTMRDRSQDMDQLEALGQVVRASRAPVFAINEQFMRRGVVGGYMWQVEVVGKQLAEMATSILKGASARDVPAGRVPTTLMLDWRQLGRWNIPDARVPAAAVVLFRPRSFFELHRGYVIGGLLVFAGQLGLIVGLLVQRVRRQRAEAESRKNDARYRSVVDRQSELICRFLPDSTLTFVNDAYCRFWNKTREELLGRKFIELIPPSARQPVLDRLGHVSSESDSHEHPVLLIDGTIGWHHWINQAIVDGQGRLIELQGVGRDITDRKRAEEAVGLLEARNSAMLRAIPDLMFVLQRDGTFVDHHARDAKLLFLPPEQFVGRSVRDVMPPGLADLLMDAIERACRGEDPVIIEYELQLSELRHFEARLVDAGQDRVLSIVRDVTESKRALAANRDLAGRLITSQESERTRIARDLHDDVCQEVAALSVDVSHLRQQNGDVRSLGVQDALLSLQRRAAGVAESLRLISHGLHPSVLHHIGLVAALQAHCAEVERQHHVNVSFRAAGDVEPASRLVALSLFRIAQEALRNSALHGRARHATLSLMRSDEGLALEIADDGKGFDVAAARRNGGLGLLSIEERARLVKGRVAIRSRPGDGTTIGVRVPADVVDHPSGQES